jgi:CPA2 family monovalent cation:H+ antiporter-2
MTVATVESFLAEALIVLGASVVVLLVSHRLRLAPVVGLLLTGVLIGPSGLGWFGDSAAVGVFAEIGVVFLLFSVGLEFPLRRLREIRRAFFLGGAVQAGGTIAVVAAAAVAAGVAPRRALFFGFVLALSSTAVVLKLYGDRRETESPQARTATGILLFQDFLLVPMVALTPLLAGSGDLSVGPLALRFGAGVAAVAAVFWIARHLMPRLLEQLVRTRIREIFVLGALFVCLGMAYVTESLGFSFALGAFVAGIVVSESGYSPQVAAETIPFRDVFASVFFVSIGMLVDLGFVLENGLRVVGLALFVVLVKALTAGGAAAVVGFPARIVTLVGLGLAQIGEFSFVLLNLGRSSGVVGAEAYQTLIAVAVLTLLATPPLLALGPHAGSRLPGWLAGRAPGRDASVTAGDDRPRGHVVVVGYGLNGRTLSQVLREVGIRHVVVELDGEAVTEGVREGAPMVFGDATRREILEHVNVAAAQAVVFAISDLEAVRRGIALTRKLNPDVYVLVRTPLVQEIEELRACGADEVIAEEFESAIEIFTRVLDRFHVPRNIVRAQTRLLRGEGYRMLRAPALRGEVSAELLRVLEAGTTELFRLEAESPAVGLTLRELDLRRRAGATVIAVVRDETPMPNPTPDLQLEAGDVLVIVGSHEEVDRAMEHLEPPRQATPAQFT